VRRKAGTTIGTIVREEIAAPLGLELDIGTPPETQSHVAPVVVPVPDELEILRDRVENAASPFGRMLLAIDGDCLINTADAFFAEPANLALELPAANATATARALAKLYGVLANGGSAGDTQLISASTIAAFAAERVRGPDRVGVNESRWGLGFARPVPPPPGLLPEWGPHDESFGHPGFGGQIAFADPISGLGIGFVRSHFSFGSPLGSRLVEATYAALD
jgi:CubicO group peptidase (beta-lactamase class C family)